MVKAKTKTTQVATTDKAEAGVGTRDGPRHNQADVGVERTASQSDSSLRETVRDVLGRHVTGAPKWSCS